MVKNNKPNLCLANHIAHYSKVQRPKNQENSQQPLEIQNSLDVVDLRIINENEYFITVSVHLRLTWVDERLRLFINGTQSLAEEGYR